MPTPKLLDQHIAASCQIDAYPAPFGGPEINREAAFLPMHQIEGQGQLLGAEGAPTHPVTVDRLHLDDLRAEVGQDHRAIGPGDSPVVATSSSALETRNPWHCGS